MVEQRVDICGGAAICFRFAVNTGWLFTDGSRDCAFDGRGSFLHNVFGKESPVRECGECRKERVYQ